MIITVKNLQDQTFTINFDERQNVLELKKQIFKERGPEYVVEKQKLIYAGVILQDERTISSYNVDEKKFVVVMVKRDLGFAPQQLDATEPSSSHTDPSNPESSCGLDSELEKNDSTTTENTSGEKSGSDEDTKSIGSGGSGGSGSEITAVGSGTSILSTTSGASLLSGSSVGSGDSESSHSTYSSGDLAGVFSNTSLQSRAESNLLVGEEYNCSVDYMVEMGYSREMVERAMQASFNNPERAVEYLISGIPETEEDLITAPGADSVGGDGIGTRAAIDIRGDRDSGNDGAGLVRAVGSGIIGNVSGQTHGSIIPDFVLDQTAIAAGNADGPLQQDPFECLRNQPQFLQMRSLVYQNPDLLHAILQQIARTNPALLQLISDNQDAFLSMLNQPMDDENNPERAQLDPNVAASGDGTHVEPRQRPEAGPIQRREAGDPGVIILPPRPASAAERRAAAVSAFIRERAEAAAALAALTAAASEAVDRDAGGGAVGAGALAESTDSHTSTSSSLIESEGSGVATIRLSPQDQDAIERVSIHTKIQQPPQNLLKNYSGKYPFECLRNQPQFLQMRSLVYQNPDLLHAILQQIARTNPALLQLISDNQDAFLSMLNQPMDDENNPERAQLDPNVAASGDGTHVEPRQRPEAGPIQRREAGDPGVIILPPRPASAAERRAAAVSAFIRERAEAAAALAALTAAASEAVDRDAGGGAVGAGALAESTDSHTSTSSSLIESEGSGVATIRLSPQDQDAIERINNLPPQLFYCQSLRILIVNNNSLESIPNAIGSLRQLQHLNLGHNLISNIPYNIKTCKNLTHLDLSCNNLQRLPDAITCLISLQELLLNETYLEFLPANFGRLVNLKILELRLNNLITLPKSIVRLVNLQRIDIGGNEFTELPEVIGELKQLRELWIDFNQIRRISPNVSKLRELQHFEANGNLIDTLPNEISHWCNIEVLSVCTNTLKALPFSIGMMKSLVTLKCESNELCELPDSISYLENLEELVLSHNKLLRLPATIGMLRKLRFLFADGNELRGLPKEVCNCSNLSVLSVSCNKITELPQNIGHLTKLKVLNLVNNYIATLPVSVLSLVNLSSLWISDNQSQPLVPLQYLDAATKAHLTCFMLPQDGLRQHQLKERSANAQHPDEHDEYSQQLLDQQRMQLSTRPGPSRTVVDCISPSRRICFAEETTILTTAAHVDSKTSVNGCIEVKEGAVASKNSAIATQPAEQLRVRLMRSPTPYPKELRLMAKYLRNGQKMITSANKSSSEMHMLNCDTSNLRSNDVQSNPNTVKSLETAESGEFHDSVSPLPSPINENYTIDQKQHQQQPLYSAGGALQTMKYQQMLQQPESRYDDEQQQFFTAYYVAPTNSNSVCGNDVAYNYKIMNSQKQETSQVLSNYYIDTSLQQPLLEPPPYHIARVFTKKTSEDLTNYDTLRNRHQQQEFQQQNYHMNMADIKEQQNHDQAAAAAVSNGDIVSPKLNEKEYSIIELNSNNSSLRVNTKTIPVVCYDHQNNFLTADASHHPHKGTDPLNNINDPDVTDMCGTPEHFQQLSESLSQLSICSSNSTTTTRNSKSQTTNFNDGKISLNKKTPWLFGVHKNPTVKQVAIKRENHVGFDVAEYPNKDGIFVSSIVPNTNAARLLCVNDKLLEIDGYDITNIRINDVRTILQNSGSVIRVMLSRK